MESKQDKVPHPSSDNSSTDARNSVETRAVSQEINDSSSEQSGNDKSEIEKILEQNREMAESMKQILARLDDSHDKEQLITRLNTKLDQHERDFVFNNILKRMFLDLIRLYDRVDRMCSDDSDSKGDVSDSRKNLQSIHKEILEVIKRNGIEVRDVMGQIYDDEVSEAVKVTKVDDPDSDKRIIKMLTPAFIYSGRLLKPALVILGKFEKPDKGNENE